MKTQAPTVTVTGARADDDGSYDVMGTKAGAPVMLQASSDLATITEHTGGPGGPDGPGSASDPAA